MSANQQYYQFQASARGLASVADVEALVDIMSPVYQRLLSNWLPASRSALIYEVACGPGIMLRHLQRQGYTQLAGSDSSAAQIELAQAGGLKVDLADSIAQLKGHPDERWDCLIAIDFIEHLPKDVLVEFLAQARRTLKKGGCLIMRAPNGDSPLVGRNLFNDITHYWAYTSIATSALLKMSRFSRAAFADESLASIERHRWLKVPLMKMSQFLLRFLLRSATREQVDFLGSSLYIAAWK